MQVAWDNLLSMTYPVLQYEYLRTLSHKRHDFRKKSYWVYNWCFDFLCNFSLKHFSFLEEFSEILLYMYIGLYVQYRHSCSILIKLKFSPQIFEIYSSIKFNTNLSSGSRVVPLGRAGGRTDGQT
jgi:hypothetical protein